MSDPTVTVAEIGAALGRKVEQVEREAAELGMLVRPDWAGHPSLTVDDARGLASGEARRHLEHDRAWQAHLEACRLSREGRDRAAREAAAKIRAAARREAPPGMVDAEARRGRHRRRRRLRTDSEAAQVQRHDRTPLEFIEVSA